MKTSTTIRKPQAVSESRRIRKPLMEKKRRARINDSLETLKQILLEAKTTLKSSSRSQRSAKLEKADILEMTVLYLQQLHGKTKSSALNNKPKSFEKNDSIISAQNRKTDSREVDETNKTRKSVIIAKKSEVTIRQADSSCDSYKAAITLLPTKLITGEVVYFLPSRPAVTQKGDFGEKCDEANCGPLWRPW